MAKILITGATGTIGNQVARRLIERGETPRVGTRKPDSAAALAELGAEVVQLDLEQLATLERAFDGVDRLFLVGPATEDFGERTEHILSTAKRAGVGSVVRISALGADVEGSFTLARQHGLADQHLERSGLGWTVLRPNFFQDNIFTFQAQSLSEQGVFYGASGEGRAAYVSSADIAAVAVEVLLDPGAHNGKAYALTGPEALAAAQIADLVTQVTGKAVSYTDLTPEQFAAPMKEQGAPGWWVEAMLALENVKRQGWAEAVTSHVEEVTGRAPETYRAFIERNRGRIS